MNKIWIVIVISLVIILCIGFYSHKSLEKITEKYQLINQDFIEQVDSLNKVNKDHLNKIDSLSLNIINLNNQIEFLNKDREELKDKIYNFTISSNLSEGVELLRQNICSH